mgnify:CR=1 FL=1
MEFDQETALLVVDVQNDFADPAGSLYVQGGEHVIQFINERIGEAVEAGTVVDDEYANTVTEPLGT